MTIDTHIDGNPESIRVSAAWLRDHFASCLDTTTDTLYSARNNSDAAWDGPTSEAACQKMDFGARRTDDMAAAARRCATAVEEFASALQSAQNQMVAIRNDAISAGLVLAGNMIRDVDPDSEALRYAYEAAAHAADAAREAERLAGETLANVWAGITGEWFFSVADLLGAAGRAMADKHVSLLTNQARFLMEESRRYLDLARSAPPGTPASQIYRDFDWSRTVARNADDLLETAKNLEAKAGKLSGRFGGALAVIGIGYDIYTGKPVDQALVSGGLGFGAAVAAGALIGSAIPAPIVGTAVGAAGGAVVGIFTSGTVDTLYTEGLGSVGEAIGDGAAAIADTGYAIGELAAGAWDAIF
ncbi:hypothetical protein [Rhodococcus sp. BP22]|uniref:hypothetical protein n=1 Tax=Rhodococcus sp. BP22 TaxID=2758566 RepID=UPI001648AA05|nr:hypothetical protein [Rhodococcus sp. BP22]